MSVREILDSQFVGMHEVRKNLTKLLRDLEEEAREVNITRQGKRAAAAELPLLAGL